MHVAANMGIMTSLMKHGAIYNIKNKKGETPLDLSKDKIISSFLILTHELFNASESDGEIIVQKLSKLTRDETVAIANVQNVQGNTLLQNATLNQPPGIVKNLRKFLLEKKIIL
ncbi:ANK_REP_REGION domain-containing protein [Trichonephila clavata]|nr:ANK_REP_REGION domain-containing protein [Trichonephila clavata]